MIFLYLHDGTNIQASGKKEEKRKRKKKEAIEVLYPLHDDHEHG